MSFDDVVHIATEAVDIIDDANRNGVVNSHGYTDEGCPIGGHYTWDAVGLINEAEALFDSIGCRHAPF